MDLTPIGEKMLEPKTLTLTTDSSKHKEIFQKEYVPEDPESGPSLSDSSSSESDSSNDRKYSKSKRELHNKNRNHQKRTK